MLNLAMPRCATDNWGATLAHSIWPCLAMQLMTEATLAPSIWQCLAMQLMTDGQHLHTQSGPCLAMQLMTEGQHRHTQSGHALLCKRWPRGNIGILNLAMPRCASDDWEVTPYSIWHASLCNWQPRGNTGILNLAMPRCARNDRGVNTGRLYIS